MGEKPEHVPIVKSLWERLTPGLPFEVLSIFFVSTTVLIVFQFQGRFRYYRTVVRPYFGIDKEAFFGIARDSYKSVVAFLLLFVIVAVISRTVDRNRLRDLGLRIGDWKCGLKWTGIFVAGMLPIVIAASFFSDFADKYPLTKAAGSSVSVFLLYELIQAAHFFAWEFFFRGYMLFGLEKHIGKIAILVQMVPFALMHYAKPEAEALGAVFAGIILGYFALRTRSFLYCFLLHYVVAVAMDVSGVFQGGGFG